MSAKSERPKRRRVKLVGGGYRYTREAQAKEGSGSLKAQRRALRQALKRNKRGKEKIMTPDQQRAIKTRLAELLRQKDGR